MNARNETTKSTTTLDYYNKNAKKFITGTISVDFGIVQNRFLDKLHPGAEILDYGCGSGRDTKYFLEQGCKVTAIDGSQELCKLASEYTGIPVKHMDGKWASVQQAEVDVSLVKEDYIIDGKIDLVKGVDGTVEIVDFKSERKPDMVKMRERLEHYRRQLQIYAYLIEQRTGQKVSKMHLYYTGEENGNPMITYPYTRTAIEGTVAAFDDTVHKILRKDFKHRCDDAKTCKNCDFRYYCNK